MPKKIGSSDLACQYAVVGPDSAANFRLSEVLRRVRAPDAVHRFLETDHAERFAERTDVGPLVIFFDLLGADLTAGTEFIGRMRDAHPKAVFTLYIDRADFSVRRKHLPGGWQNRLDHYYKLFQENDPSIEYEPVVRAALQQADWEARHNTTNEPIRLTRVFEQGLRQPPSGEPSDAHIAFVSYARRDWDDFVSNLVTDLSQQSQRVWIDQEYIAGGDDWMDAIGQALQACDKLLLILSPDSITSKYVKMEYRYFFNQGKPIIPILYKKIDQMPFELATLNYIDFSTGEHSTARRKLLDILSRRGQGA